MNFKNIYFKNNFYIIIVFVINVIIFGYFCIFRYFLVNEFDRFNLEVFDVIFLGCYCVMWVNQDKIDFFSI